MSPAAIPFASCSARSPRALVSTQRWRCRGSSATSLTSSGGAASCKRWSRAVPASPADVVDESLSRTNLGDLQPGDPVNLERPVRPTGRLGGHVVQGHVDAVGEVVDPAPHLRVRLPDDLARYVVEKGSIAVDGCS